MKKNNIEKSLDILKQAKRNANDGERLPSIPPSKVFKTSKKDKRDNPKHKKKISQDY